MSLRISALMLLMTAGLAGCGGTGGVAAGEADGRLPPAPAGSEVVYRTETNTIAGEEACQMTFEMNVASTLTIAYAVEPGRNIDIYVLTQEQNRRAASGVEPRVVGRDFIERHRGMHDTGGFVTRLEAGPHAIVLRNLSSRPVRVTSRVTAQR
jgi:hypothetical protein